MMVQGRADPGKGGAAHGHSRGRLEEDVTDEELVAQVLAGRTGRFAFLVRRHQASLFRQALAMGLDRDTAEDMVQDSLVRAFQGLEGCREKGRFRVWVTRILRNRCLDHLKSAPMQRNDPLVPDILYHDGGPEEDRERAALRALLAEALRRLPEEQREAFLLRHVDGFSYQEMCEIADASESALKMRVHRAREALRACLGGAGAEQDVTVGGGSSS